MYRDLLNRPSSRLFGPEFSAFSSSLATQDFSHYELNATAELGLPLFERLNMFCSYSNDVEFFVALLSLPTSFGNFVAS